LPGSHFAFLKFLFWKHIVVAEAAIGSFIQTATPPKLNASKLLVKPFSL